MLLRQVDEWAFRNYQESQPFKHLPSRGRHKAVPHSCNVDQVVVFVISNDDGIETVSTRDVSADYKLLTKVDPVFDPGAAPLSGLVQTIFSLADDPFESLLTNSPEDVRCGCLNAIRKCEFAAN